MALSKGITLLESTRSDHQTEARKLLQAFDTQREDSMRIAISGAPGVGKSTFIESFGNFVLDKGYRPAVLSIDPSSTITGGSILGDKTRMDDLSRNENAFIRPSPSNGKLGGTADKTREVMLLCEAAGYNIILIETVGVGQSEIDASLMTDVFMLLLLPNAGDTLQGIKKGIVEMADILIVNKSDGDNITNAKHTKKHYEEALHLMPIGENGWNKSCTAISAIKNMGLNQVWQQLQKYFAVVNGNGTLTERRKLQNISWFKNMAHARLMECLSSQASYKILMLELEKQIITNKMNPTFAADQFLTTISKNLLI